MRLGEIWDFYDRDRRRGQLAGPGERRGDKYGRHSPAARGNTLPMISAGGVNRHLGLDAGFPRQFSSRSRRRSCPVGDDDLLLGVIAPPPRSAAAAGRQISFFSMALRVLCCWLRVPSIRAPNEHRWNTDGPNPERSRLKRGCRSAVPRSRAPAGRSAPRRFPRPSRV